MLLIANWKQNKTEKEALSWVDNTSKKINNSENVTIIVAPVYTHIPIIKKKIVDLNLNIKLASQDISEYKKGAHTGEVSGNQLREYVEYSIIGHSERRNVEDYEDINNKIKMAIEVGIIPIICFRNLEDYNAIDKKLLSGERHYFAYEPVYAIGTGVNAPSNEIEEIINNAGLDKVIYGGSVDRNTIKNYINLQSIDGFLVGTASLDSDEFFEIYKILSN